MRQRSICFGEIGDFKLVDANLKPVQHPACLDVDQPQFSKWICDSWDGAQIHELGVE